jgi:hypothetical protein
MQCASRLTPRRHPDPDTLSARFIHLRSEDAEVINARLASSGVGARSSRSPRGVNGRRSCCRLPPLPFEPRGSGASRAHATRAYTATHE